ncbi:hypothetical protein [Peribacillus sp. NPDC096448]|uniref:hypothetical protein n=1 Tax=Peribacillus sp. NPDC096448 TaxID=3364395 RepID=UPI003809FF3E
MFKKLLKGMFNSNTSTPLKPQETKQCMPKKEMEKDFHKQKSVELSQKARNVFDRGDIDASIELIEKSNEHLIRTFAENGDEINAARFFGVNREEYLAAKEMKIPIRGIQKNELNLIHKEVCWFALNGIKANYVLMSFLMFKEYEWLEFDEELQRAKNSSNPEEYEIYYYIKNELKEKVDLSEYKEKFYSLSLEARVFLTSYNAVGRKKYLKEVKDVEAFYHERGAKELRAAGYMHSTDNGEMIEFPVNEKKQVLFEKKKLETLMRHLSTLAHWKKEYKYGKFKFENGNVPNAVFLVNGAGGSTLCKAEAIPVKGTKEMDLQPHSIGCKCDLSFCGKPERLLEMDKEKYTLK